MYMVYRCHTLHRMLRARDIVAPSPSPDRDFPYNESRKISSDERPIHKYEFLSAKVFMAIKDHSIVSIQ
ncbi:MAG: hypothetical protein ACFFDQ_12100, partial [Candidatus Thorarchaeota archaeon]